MTLTTHTRRVTAYRTTDGKVFADKAEARRHQGELVIRHLATTILYEMDGSISAAIAEHVIANTRLWLDALIEMSRASASNPTTKDK